jgi:hypothetical protein
MEPTELDAMINQVYAQHARQHEIWMALHPVKSDHPVLFAMVDTLSQTIEAHLRALTALQVLLDQESPSQRGA